MITVSKAGAFITYFVLKVSHERICELGRTEPEGRVRFNEVGAPEGDEECMVIQEDTVEDISAQHNTDIIRGIIDLTSDQHIFPPILHPKGFMHAPIHHVNRNVNADARCIVGMTNIDPTYHINLPDKGKKRRTRKRHKEKSR